MIRPRPLWGAMAQAGAVALLAGGAVAWATSADGVAGALGAAVSTPPAGSWPGAGPSGASPGPVLAAPGRPSSARSSAVPTSGPPSPARVAAAPAPTLLEIPRIGARMPVRPVGVAADGQMSLPERPAEAGWYRYGPAPDDVAGAVVIAAHVDSREHGVGPLAQLRRLAPGDEIIVHAGSTSWRYTVSTRDQTTKESVDYASLFRRDGPPRLHLVTCGGAFDPVGRRYADNVIVQAMRQARA